MAREVLYRRSFHSDRDLKGMESLHGLDRALVARKLFVDTKASTADGGFEAPRNSLDVPFSGLLEMRRNSEVRSEDIPIGYELSRSLTTRRRSEECASFKPILSSNSHLESKYIHPKISSELDHNPRVPSVVARLMGLDALPHHEKMESSNYSSLRRALTQESNASAALSSAGEIPVEDQSKGKLGHGELPLRNHPQENQLQEFKREFTAHQALQERCSVSRLNSEGSTLQQKKEDLIKLEPQMDSEEFLDALNFLNANKDFFVKVLSDPHSLFAKHLQQPGGSFSSMENGPTRQVDGKLLRCSSERNPLCLTDDLAEWKKKQECSVTDKSKALRASRWGRDEEMPGRSRRRARGPFVSNAARMGPDQIVPTRIVVLKPSLGKQTYRKTSSSLDSSSPFTHLNGIFKMRFEGKENLKQEVKERTQLRNDIGLVREHCRDHFKERSKDARIIAKQIVKHVKEDMSQRLLKDGMCTMDSILPVSCSTGRKEPYQKVSSDASGVHDNGKICSKVPSLANLSTNDRESEHRHFSFNTKKGFCTDESKRSSYKNLASSSKNCREPSKVDEGMIGSHDSCTKQSMRDCKTVKKTGRSNSFKLRDSKCEGPRVLPRSLSAPAVATVENRTLESEQKGGATVEKATCLSRARPVENSPFKERLLSLKDSFSLSKKRGNKKLTSPPCSSALDLSEPTTPRQITLEQSSAICVERKEQLPGFEWQRVPSAKDVTIEATEKSLDEALFENSPTMQTPSGLQWPANADLADTASETSLDKCEQPSPVSVLETPFQEESPSTVDKREMDSKCHELRHKTSLLNSDYKDLPRNLHAEFFSQLSCHRSFDSLADELLDPWNWPEAHLESYGLLGGACPSWGEGEMSYVMHVLSLSGLNTNGFIMAHSLSSEQGLNASTFGRLEAYYENRSKRGGRDNGVTPLNLSTRQLLFDVVDEVVACTIKKRLAQPWAYGKCSDQKVLVCTGKQLLEKILVHINQHRFTPSEAEDEVLEDMASKDLMREAPWVHSQCDTQSVVIDLERLLCGDLIREIVHECVRRRPSSREGDLLGHAPLKKPTLL